MDKMKSDFEEWAKERGLSIKELCHNGYELFSAGEAWAAWQAAFSPPAWIPCEERLPTDADEDCDGVIWVFDGNTIDRWHRTDFLAYFDEFKPLETHWMPTNLVKPAPPETE